jgi:AAA domain/UvrD-like helicase C-terminal domain
MSILNKPPRPSFPRPASIGALRIMMPGVATDNAIAAAFQKVDRLAIEKPALAPENVDRFEKLSPADMPVVRGLSQLVSADFPFDESQLAAVNGMMEQQYACLTGAAGTGKTTVTKKLVNDLLTSISTINMRNYWKVDEETGESTIGNKYVPSIAVITFTGKASQMVKKNFPVDWHGNIMTIHRCLAFKPEFYTDFDVGTGKMKEKMRFVPTYDSTMKLPWDIIVIDEAGMLGLDLWNQLWDAMPSTTRVYMIGDINQLPPVHGRSIFGFAMTRWPTFELTHIHRQKVTTEVNGEGVEIEVKNPIVEAAWDVIHGRRPTSSPQAELLDPNKPGFYMQEIKGNVQVASKTIRAAMMLLREKGIMDPHRDTAIVAINGHDPASPAYGVGQIPLNNSMAQMFNTDPSRPRYRIYAGREHRDLATGDKVMATQNDHESGITNGMTGIVRDIQPNGAWFGDMTRYGKIDDLRAMNSADDDARLDAELAAGNFELTADDIMGELESDAKKLDEEGRGPSSHIVTVEFAHDTDQPVTKIFSTAAEVATIQLAYFVTGHKMQGGEAPIVVILAHDSTRRMIYREWLYTCITRAQVKCILFYSRIALAGGIGTQRIKGKNLDEKIQSFMALSDTRNNPLALKIRLPEPMKIEKEVA